jgi:hypothetical protein
MGATRTSADVLHGRSPTHTSATAAARAAPVARAAEGARWRAHCEQQAPLAEAQVGVVECPAKVGVISQSPDVHFCTVHKIRKLRVWV